LHFVYYCHVPIFLQVIVPLSRSSLWGISYLSSATNTILHLKIKVVKGNLI
jgi:hypothetical protein